MAKKKTAKKTTTATTPKAAPTKKAGRRGGRKPGHWVHLKKDQVAQYRKDAKLSRGRLAEMLDVSPTSIQNWETGKSIPVKRYQLRLVEVMSGKTPSASETAVTAPRGSSRRAVAPAGSSTATDSSPLQLQVTRLSVVGEILKGFMATAQGAKLSGGGLVELAGALRSALT